jgi:hypothetical protein
MDLHIYQSSVFIAIYIYVGLGLSFTHCFNGEKTHRLVSIDYE